jgi:hypothetical protein
MSLSSACLCFADDQMRSIAGHTCEIYAISVFVVAGWKPRAGILLAQGQASFPNIAGLLQPLPARNLVQQARGRRLFFRR